MKLLVMFAGLSLAFLSALNAADPVTVQDQQLLTVIKQIQAQQVTIADNQAKIEAKLATVGEAVRVAKIYSSRGGR